MKKNYQEINRRIFYLQDEFSGVAVNKDTGQDNVLCDIWFTADGIGDTSADVDVTVRVVYDVDEDELHYEVYDEYTGDDEHVTDMVTEYTRYVMSGYVYNMRQLAR